MRNRYYCLMYWKLLLVRLLVVEMGLRIIRFFVGWLWCMGGGLGGFWRGWRRLGEGRRRGSGLRGCVLGCCLVRLLSNWRRILIGIIHPIVLSSLNCTDSSSQYSKTSTNPTQPQSSTQPNHQPPNNNPKPNPK